MLKILHDRLIRLGRDEDGVALVVTLGVFMFLYVACASVYAVGMAVKEKMHLQGACDAAAYSAAIVQADTFSRIATINRAMSWTYQQMTRRQMDYIVWQWLLETIDHYNDDEAAAQNYVKEHVSDSCPNRLNLCSWGIGWKIDDVIINEHSDKPRWTRNQLERLCGNGSGSFGEYLKNNKDSFYSRREENLHGGGSKNCGLARQIDDDLRNIRDMSSAVVNLARQLPRHVEDAVEGILAANIPSYMHKTNCLYFIEQNRMPLNADNGYFQPFPNTRRSELIFLSIGDNIYQDAEEAFRTGANSWFNRDDENTNQWGFHRHYPRNRSTSPLVSEWDWWAFGWECVKDQYGNHLYDQRTDSIENCRHGHERCRCESRKAILPYRYRGRFALSPHSSGQIFHATCRANNNGDYGYDNRFEGRIDGQIVRARPLRLRRAYFGSAGTITVGLARRNENPWFSLFGHVSGGIYSAFSPVANSWTYCFASAKAGYKLYHEPKDWYINAHLGSATRTRKLEDWEEKLNGKVRVSNEPRDYCIDWKQEESKLAGWYWTYKKDEDGNYVIVNGHRVRDKLVTEWTALDDLRPTWRQSWNLVQDDWDAVMVPVRQGDSRAQEVSNYSLQQWWQHRLSGQYLNVADIPYRYEPVWQNRNDNHIASLVNQIWLSLSGSGTPNINVTAGPTYGDRGDTLRGRLAGQIWEDHWKRGIPPPAATGTSQWNIERPGERLDWNRIGDEMYH